MRFFYTIHVGIILMVLSEERKKGIRVAVKIFQISFTTITV